MHYFCAQILTIVHLVIQGSVAQVYTHFYTNAEKSCDEVIALQNALLLQLHTNEKKQINYCCH